jgi:regulator of cell morphogenesis and NO signaling
MATAMTLADWADTSLSAVRILEQHGLDYCCGGKQLFEEACLAKGVKPQIIIRAIEEAQVASVAGRDWETAPLDELLKHIVGTHHEYLKLDLPVLGHRLSKVVSVHGARDPEVLPRMAEVFAALRAEMELHMHKEEAILFPFIEQYGRA